MRLLLIVLIACVSLPAFADVIHLKDGTKVEGKVAKSEGGWTVTTPDGKVVNVPADQMGSLELVSGRGTKLESAQAGLQSLRRASENMRDPKLVIERYERFIQQSAGTPAADDAKRDLDLWQQRAAQGLVKVAKEWVTAEQAEKLRAEAGQKAQAAAQLVQQGQWTEAGEQIQQTLAADPDNAGALYLRGLMLLKQEQVPGARKAFEQVEKLTPDHAPTLNNLAVISWRQHVPVGAIKYYDKAMAASPADQQILDNTAEALHALSDEEREAEIVAKVQREFEAQDAQLQVKMNAKGLYRWGALWIAQKDKVRLEAAERKMRQKVDKLLQQAQTDRAELARIEQEIAENEREMQTLQLSGWVTDTNGRRWRTGDRNRYNSLESRNRSLRDKQAELNARLQNAAQDVERAQQELPTPQYNGVQQVIGAEGMPGVAAAAEQPPATPPADGQ